MGVMTKGQLLDLAIEMFEAQRVYWDEGRTLGALTKARQLEKTFGKALKAYRKGPGLFDRVEPGKWKGPPRVEVNDTEGVEFPETFGRKWTPDEVAILQHKGQEWAEPIFCGCADCVRELEAGRVFRHPIQVARDLSVWMVGAVAVLREGSDANPSWNNEDFTAYLRHRIREEEGE